MIKKIVTFVMAALMLVTICFASQENLREEFRDKPIVTIYLENIVDQTEAEGVSTEAYRQAFVKSAQKRISKKFIVVEEKVVADVVLTVELKKYIYDEKAKPFRRVGPWFITIIAILEDFLNPKSSAILDAKYTITVPREYKDCIMMGVRKFRGTITAEQGFKLISEENVNRFIYTTFLKK